MFKNLIQNLENALKTLKGKGRITDVNIAATVKEIRRALIKADVHYPIAKQVTDTVKAKALGKQVLTAISPEQLFIKIVHEELTSLMGSEKAAIHLTGNPSVVLMVGLQGSGKTTCAGKLAAYFGEQNKTVLLVACDIYRPAAVDQLQIIGKQIGVEVYAEPNNKNALTIAQNAMKYAKVQQQQVVIIDTAGRLAIDETMMQELVNLKAVLKPSEVLFVVDAMIGQDAVNTAQAFNERLAFDGVVLTKLDGDARGGAALSIRNIVGKPVKFIGTGERITDWEVFHPSRMANRILGMGDVVSLVEKAERAYDQEQTKRLEKKLRKNEFDFNDFLKQLQQLKKMGNLQNIVSMIPGMSKLVGNKELDESKFKPIEAIIHSMTPQERSYPKLLNQSRRARISRGSGVGLQQVNIYLKQVENMRKMMGQFSQKNKQQHWENLMK